MKIYFKDEFKRALFGRNAIISFLITLGVLIVLFMNYIGLTTFNFQFIKYFLENPSCDAIDAFLTVISGSIIIVFPILATIIFSESYLAEKQSGFIKFVYARISVTKYVFVKVAVNSIVSALVGGIASLLILITSVLLFGIKDPGIASYTNNIKGPFSSLLASGDTRLLYGVIIVILFSLGYMVMASLALGISAWIKNKYLVVILPFFYYIFCGTVLEMLGVNRIFDFHLARVLFIRHSMTTAVHAFLYPILLFIVGVVLFYVGVVIKNEKDL